MTQKPDTGQHFMTIEELTDYVNGVVGGALAAYQATLDANAAYYAAAILAENDENLRQYVDRAVAKATVRYVVGVVRRDHTFGWLGVVIGIVLAVVGNLFADGFTAEQHLVSLGSTIPLCAMLVGGAGYLFDLCRNQQVVQPLTAPIPFPQQQGFPE